MTDQAPVWGIALWRTRSREALGQIGGNVWGFCTRWSGSSAVDKALCAGFLLFALGGIGMSVYMAGPGMAAIQAMGFAGGGAALMSQRLKYNHHKIALSPALNFLMGAQYMLLGGYAFAAMGLAAGLRGLTLSMIPADPRYARARMATAMAISGAGMAGIGILSYFTGSAVGMMAFFSMACGAAVDSIPSSKDPARDYSRYARVVSLGRNLNNALYDLCVSGSLGGMFMSTTLFVNQAASIRNFDMPARDRGGERLSYTGAIGRYLRSMWHNAPLDGLTPDQLKPAVINGAPAQAMPVAAAQDAAAPAAEEKRPPSIKEAWRAEARREREKTQVPPPFNPYGIKPDAPRTAPPQP